MKKKYDCPLCGKETLASTEKDDFQFLPAAPVINKCENCGFVFENIVPVQEEVKADLMEYINSAEYGQRHYDDEMCSRLFQLGLIYMHIHEYTEAYKCFMKISSETNDALSMGKALEILDYSSPFGMAKTLVLKVDLLRRMKRFKEVEEYREFSDILSYQMKLAEQKDSMLHTIKEMKGNASDQGLENLFLGGKFIVRNARTDKDYETGKTLLKMGMMLGSTDAARELLQTYERDACNNEDLIMERLQCVRMIIEKTEDAEETYRLIRGYYPHMPVKEALEDLDRIINGFGIHDSLKTLAIVLSVKIDKAHYSKRYVIQKAYENRFLHECLEYLKENLCLSQLDFLSEETAMYFYEKMTKEGKEKEFIDALKHTNVYYKDTVLEEIGKIERNQKEKKESMKKRYDADMLMLHKLLSRDK